MAGVAGAVHRRLGRADGGAAQSGGGGAVGRTLFRGGGPVGGQRPAGGAGIRPVAAARSDAGGAAVPDLGGAAVAGTGGPCGAGGGLDRDRWGAAGGGAPCGVPGFGSSDGDTPAGTEEIVVAGIGKCNILWLKGSEKKVGKMRKKVLTKGLRSDIVSKRSREWQDLPTRQKK